MHIEITGAISHVVYRPGKKKKISSKCWLGYGAMKGTAGKDVNCQNDFGKQFSITL